MFLTFSRCLRAALNFIKVYNNQTGCQGEIKFRYLFKLTAYLDGGMIGLMGLVK